MTAMTPHVADRCPCNPDDVVAVDLHDGNIYVETARAVHWGPGLADDGAGRVHAYRVMLPAAAGTTAATVD
ncbi:hypothetical protein LDC_1422 [sediment metagenome]|uniref:Uncharacterized protein n=1 Tax=sediment metagenome TaxID=749907 RepID=D9PIR4_9ZZZZ